MPPYRFLFFSVNYDYEDILFVKFYLDARERGTVHALLLRLLEGNASSQVLFVSMFLFN